MKTGFHILVVGCGNLGSRHLQAVASLPQVGSIDVVDPRPEALEIGRRLLDDIPVRSPSPSIHWTTSLGELSKGGDLCIVATQAEGRAQLIKQVATSFKYGKFLIEKIVAQSVSEYSDLLSFAKENTLSIWVNCKTRAYPITQWIKRRLHPSEPILFNVLAGNHGLANNGIHEADLFVFFDRCQSIESRGSYIDPILHPSKRGPHVFDLSGTLFGVTERGSQCTISFMRDHNGPDHISVVTKSYRSIVDHFGRWAVESDEGGSWREIPFEGNLMVSQMTKTFVADILTAGQCQLPTLKECYPAHRFILESLQPHFSRLLNQKLSYCPVT